MAPYDSNAGVFRCLADNGILSCIKVRKRMSKLDGKEGTSLENLSVLAQRNDLQKWKDIVLTMDKDRLQKPYLLV